MSHYYYAALADFQGRNPKFVSKLGCLETLKAAKKKALRELGAYVSDDETLVLLMSQLPTSQAQASLSDRCRRVAVRFRLSDGQMDGWTDLNEDED